MGDCYVRHEDRIARIFGMYGRFLERHPVKILVISITVNCLLGLGMLRLEVESGAERLYTPVNSQASKDRSFLEDIYPSSSEFYAHKETADFAEVLILTGGKTRYRRTFMKLYEQRSNTFPRIMDTLLSSGSGATWWIGWPL